MPPLYEYMVHITQNTTIYTPIQLMCLNVPVNTDGAGYFPQQQPFKQPYNYVKIGYKSRTASVRKEKKTGNCNAITTIIVKVKSNNTELVIPVIDKNRSHYIPENFTIYSYKTVSHIRQ
jgi:hypothetical protein